MYINAIRPRDKQAYCREDRTIIHMFARHTHNNDIAAEFKMPSLNELTETVSVFFFLLIAWVVIINMIRSIQNLHCQTSRLLVCQGHAGLWGEPLGLISTFVTAWTFTITGEKLDGCNETRD